MMFEENKDIILVGDNRETLKQLPEKIVDCVVTSPPYFHLRSYTDSDKEIGKEPTVEEYVQSLVDTFRETRRVLKDDGVVWVNLGDTYYSSNKQERPPQSYMMDRLKDQEDIDQNELYRGMNGTPRAKADGVKFKNGDLCGVPWLFALAMREDGWYLRSEVIWHKTVCLPEAVKDRPNRNHEHIFLFSKKRDYYFDYEAIKEPSVTKAGYHKNKKDMNRISTSDDTIKDIGKPINKITSDGYVSDGKKLRRTVWTIGPSKKSEVEGHYATYSEDLVIPCVLSGSRIGGIVLDPFGGSGTTGAVAKKNDRHYILCELNEEWAEQAKERLKNLKVVKGIKKNDFFE